MVNKMRGILVLLLAGLTPLVESGPVVGDPEVNVYSHRHYRTDQQLFELFQQQTGIRVNVVKAKADQLIERLRNEGDKSPADLLITVDAGRLYRAKNFGLLQPIRSTILEANIPAELRDPAGTWYGLTRRVRLVVYHPQRVRAEELSTYEDLAQEKWRGRILVRSSSNIYNQSLLASIIARKGPEAAKRWAAGIVRNLARPPKGNDRDQVKAIAAGVGDIAIVNSYYLGLLINSENPEERKVGKMMGVFFPNQQGSGAHINISGAGVTASSKNRQNAIRLLEFLSSNTAQELFARTNYEYPVTAEPTLSPLLASWGNFRSETINLSLLGRYNAEAVRIFDQVGWR